MTAFLRLFDQCRRVLLNDQNICHALGQVLLSTRTDHEALRVTAATIIRLMVLSGCDQANFFSNDPSDLTGLTWLSSTEEGEGWILAYDDFIGTNINNKGVTEAG